MNWKKWGRLYCFTGSFDLLTKAHSAYINELNAKGLPLVAILESDTSLSKRKGEKRPIYGFVDRARRIRVLGVELILEADESILEKISEKKFPNSFIAFTKNDPREKLKRAIAKSAQMDIIEVENEYPNIHSSNAIK